MVFASIREHASTEIFLRARAEIKKICFASSEQFREYNSRAASTFYISACSNPYEILFFKKKDRK